MNKQKLNRIIAMLLSLTILLLFAGCNNQRKDSQIKDELYSKAMGYLDELSNDQRVKDFLEAYELLTNLSDDQSKFITQLTEIEDIFSEYKVELKSGDYFLAKNVAIDKESIQKYKTMGAYYDAGELLNVTVYPALFDRYGQNTENINNLDSSKIVQAIKTTNNYNLTETKNQFDGYTETWEYSFFSKSKLEVKYHNNGVVKSIDIPIICSNTPLSDSEYASFFEKDTESQKQIAGNRFESMCSQFTTINMGTEILSKIFTNEEIIIISNYIHSLSLEDIWKRNLLAISGEPTTYFSAIVVFDYKDYNISIKYGLNDITLDITSNKIVNDFSTRWYTIWCGLCLPDGEGKDETIKTYSNCINNNTASNEIVQDYSFDLNANAEEFKNSTSTDAGQTQNNNNTQQDDVQQSVPVEMSMSEKLTTYGIIEKNDTAFPTYRLKLTTRLSILFDEYIGEKVFECEYLYFYDDNELNGNYPLEDFVGETCEVTAVLEDYRGGNELFMLNPIIKMN